MKVLVADYGLNVWYGSIYDYESRLSMLKEIGYDGLERLHAVTEGEVLATSALARKMGMCFATVEGNNPAERIKWASALGKDYVWIASISKDFNVFSRQAAAQIEVSEQYGVHSALHNHLGNAVETQEQLIEFMDSNPKAGLILDIGHLVGAGGDPIEIVEKYFDRIVMVHLKDFVYLDKTNEVWQQRLRFCELGTGELGDLSGDVIKLLVKKGYSRYMAVEHDTHLNDPKIDLLNSRNFIRKYGI